MPANLENSAVAKGLEKVSFHSNPKERKKESEVAQSCPTLCDPMDSSLHQAPLPMGFSRPEYGSGLPFPSPGNLPDSGINPKSPVLADGFFTTEPTRKPNSNITLF